MSEQSGNVKKFKDKEIIFEESDRGDVMYIVRSGYVRIYRRRDGQAIEYGIIGPGEFFGEMALFAERTRSASAQAKGETELELIDVDNFIGRVSDPIVWNVIKKLSERIRDIDDRIESLTMQDHVRKEHLSNLISHHRRIF
jgi:CRP/FNR family transcriptional regulator, cyclic AMP receptor protein